VHLQKLLQTNHIDYIRNFPSTDLVSQFSELQKPATTVMQKFTKSWQETSKALTQEKN